MGSLLFRQIFDAGRLSPSTKWSAGGTVDLERDKADDEPSLGAMPCIGWFHYGEVRDGALWSQEHWAEGRGPDECEMVCEDEGAKCDD